MTYLIDTDVMVDFFKHKDSAKELITRLGKIKHFGEKRSRTNLVLEP